MGVRVHPLMVTANMPGECKRLDGEITMVKPLRGAFT